LNVRDANARILLLERERDQLMRAHLKMRDKLLEYAKECIKCDGAGMVTVNHPPPQRPTVEPCPSCADLRELLDG
jgi:hypothetical protein